jgi:hypothetical protein
MRRTTCRSTSGLLSFSNSPKVPNPKSSLSRSLLHRRLPATHPLTLAVSRLSGLLHRRLSACQPLTLTVSLVSAYLHRRLSLSKNRDPNNSCLPTRSKSPPSKTRRLSLFSHSSTPSKIGSCGSSPTPLCPPRRFEGCGSSLPSIEESILQLVSSTRFFKPPTPNRWENWE